MVEIKTKNSVKNKNLYRLSIDDSFYQEICACCGDSIKGQLKVCLKKTRKSYICIGCANYLFSRMHICWDFDTYLKVKVI